MNAPTNPKRGNLNLIFLVSVSFFGLTLAVLLALNPPIEQADFAWRKPLVGSALSLVCVLGVLAVFFPNTCTKLFNVEGRQPRQEGLGGLKTSGSISHSKISPASATLRGHHPPCGRFSNHVFHLGDRLFCATCTGLFLGALFALSGAGLFFFGGWQTGQSAPVLVLVGAFGVVLGLLQSPLPMLQKGVIRLFSSAFFVVGTFLILIAVEERFQSTSVDLLFVVWSVFWLETRIALSQWDHKRICSTCTSDSCAPAG